MKLYLVRHAQPAPKEYRGFPGPALGEKGKEQAQAIAQYLAKKDIQAVYCSDYLRVGQTYAPYAQLVPALQPKIVQALREREKEIEPHESLEQRVQDWYRGGEEQLWARPTAIFSHCGPINMILEYLDPKKEQLDYPYSCPYGCHTPLGSIWELELGEDGGVEGALWWNWE